MIEDDSTVGCCFIDEQYLKDLLGNNVSAKHTLAIQLQIFVQTILPNLAATPAGRYSIGWTAVPAGRYSIRWTAIPAVRYSIRWTAIPARLVSVGPL